MSLSSFLSKPNYGMDFVVSTTQYGINQAMVSYMDYISQEDDPVTIVMVRNSTSGLDEVADYDQFLADYGIDPFTIPNGTPLYDPSVISLFSTGFKAAFKFKFGIPRPEGADSQPDPTIVQLYDNNVDKVEVRFNMYASEFQAVGVDFPDPFIHAEQTPENPWVVTAAIDLKELSLSANDPDIDNLPEDIKEKIENLSHRTFSIQELLLDFASPSLIETLTLDGIPPGSSVSNLLNSHFLKSYFLDMKRRGEPLLGAAIVPEEQPESSLELTELEVRVSPYLEDNGQVSDDPELLKFSTLDYRCAADGRSLIKPAQSFDWNWVPAKDGLAYDGVIAINKDSLANYLKDDLTKAFKDDLNKFWIEVTEKVPGIVIEIGPRHEKVTSEPTIESFASPNDKILKWSYETNTETGYDFLGIHWVGFDVTTQYTMELTFKDDKIEAYEQAIVHFYGVAAGDRREGNIVDKAVRTTWTLQPSDGGVVIGEPTIAESDKSVNINFSTWADITIVGIDDAVKNIQKSFKAFVNKTVNSLDADVSQIKDFVFPGGKSFNFGQVVFGKNQDLVSQVTYAVPQSPAMLKK